uniref:Ribosomal protein L32 n=1 Tax=Xylochloris irregularis TaxID=480381 RepID=A0A097KMB6_9CHLO|nr:ribosomal protein L32 [Xylochloris irregularis]AIT94336.1 ribosomal protein L32 [Xylochloris irregularis]
MAVPKKRLSKSKTKLRKHLWKRKANKTVNRLLSLTKSYLRKIAQEKKDG